jgi:hypothetical protein
LSAGEPGGGVQDAVTQPLGFGGGEFSLQGKQLQPGDEVGGDGGEGAPGVVDGELAGG